MVLQVKLARIRRELKLFEFAAKMGLDPQRWAKFESGKVPPPPEVVNLAASILDVPAAGLFDNV